MTTSDPRLGALDKLTVEILKDLILSLDDKYLDSFEDLVEIAAPDDLDTDDNEAEMERFYDEVERIQDRVLSRMGKALINYGRGSGDNDRLIREMNRQLKREDDTAPDNPPHIVLVHAPTAHLVRQV